MLNYRFLLIIAVIGVFLASCEKDPIQDRLKQDEMIINNDLSELSQRTSTIQGGRLMQLHAIDSDPVVKSLKSVQSKYEIYLRAEVEPPLGLDGKTLQASHIKIIGNNAFVTYNTKGPEYQGGVDVFDVSDIENPRLIQGVLFPSRDISSIDIDPKGSGNNNFIYLTGALNPELNTLGLETPAVVERFVANKANQFLQLFDNRSSYDLESFAGNDIRYLDNGGDASVYVTSGSDGGLAILNNNLVEVDYVPIPYARSIDTDGVNLVVYSAQENRIIIMDMDGGNQRIINTGGEHFIGDEYLEAKSIVRLKDNLVFVAAGTGGMEIYDIDSQQKTGSLPRPAEYENAEKPLNYVTNGVSVNGDLVLVANGGSGVHIAELENGGSVRSLGRFMFEYGSSANFVEAQDNKVFVATGKGGLKILEIVELEPTEPCGTLWGNIVDLFPERANIHEEDHPAHDLVEDGLPGTIKMLEDGPVYITFIHNGAGWHNSFGYYTYSSDEPPLLEDLNKEIIYQYVNQNNNGDDREQGERVRLGGNDKIFPAGTVIGFYIVAQGWDPDLDPPQMVDGIHTVYTTPEFNRDGVRKHVLFLEESCLDIVLGFEDMLDKSDEDFNDIMFTISNGDDIWGNEHNQYIDKEGLPIK